MSKKQVDSPLVRSLDSFPVKDGFRQRGCDMTRIETFTDAAFAFAVTLLVVSIDAIPSNYEELILALKGAPAFALSFAILMLFWHGHWQWSRRFGLEDNPTILLSCLLVFLVLCYVYPLKFLFTAMFGWMSGGWLPAIELNSAQQLHTIFVIYGSGFIAVCITMILLYAHALRHRDALQLSAREACISRTEITGWTICAGVGALSVGFALFTKPSILMLPGWIYMIMPIIMPIFGIRSDRKIRRLYPEESN